MCVFVIDEDVFFIFYSQDKVLQAKLSEQQHKINEQLMETIASEQAKEQVN